MGSQFQMGFVILGFLAMILFELIVHDGTSDVVHSSTDSLNLLNSLIKNGTCTCHGVP